MKKKHRNEIPDFSRKPARAPGGPSALQAAKQAPPATPQPTVKPRATSSKSGRRGQ